MYLWQGVFDCSLISCIYGRVMFDSSLISCICGRGVFDCSLISCIMAGVCLTVV